MHDDEKIKKNRTKKTFSICGWMSLMSMSLSPFPFASQYIYVKNLLSFSLVFASLHMPNETVAVLLLISR